MMQDPQQLNGLALAYIGDAIYEVYVRTYLIKDGQVKPQELHNHAVKYVSAHAQASVLHYLLRNGFLTEKEIGVVKRARNAKSKSSPKNMSISDYRHATAFEALLGYHYLMDNEMRLNELQQIAISYRNEQINQEEK